jgi:hypothetical protein
MGDKGAMFRSSERQQIIDYIIRSKIKDGTRCIRLLTLSEELNPAAKYCASEVSGRSHVALT